MEEPTTVEEAYEKLYSFESLNRLFPYVEPLVGGLLSAVRDQEQEKKLAGGGPFSFLFRRETYIGDWSGCTPKSFLIIALLFVIFVFLETLVYVSWFLPKRALRENRFQNSDYALRKKAEIGKYCASDETSVKCTDAKQAMDSERYRLKEQTNKEFAEFQLSISRHSDWVVKKVLDWILFTFTSDELVAELGQAAAGESGATGFASEALRSFADALRKNASLYVQALQYMKTIRIAAVQLGSSLKNLAFMSVGYAAFSWNGIFYNFGRIASSIYLVIKTLASVRTVLSLIASTCRWFALLDIPYFGDRQRALQSIKDAADRKLAEIQAEKDARVRAQLVKEQQALLSQAQQLSALLADVAVDAAVATGVQLGGDSAAGVRRRNRAGSEPP